MPYLSSNAILAIGMTPSTCLVEKLPTYLQDAFRQAIQTWPNTDSNHVEILNISRIRNISTPKLQYAQSLLLRHHVNEQIANCGVLYPPLIIERGQVYEVLGYADLAAADAIVACTLCESALSKEWITDLEPQELSGEKWFQSDPTSVLPPQIEALSLLCRSLNNLGATEDFNNKYTELSKKYQELHPRLNVSDVKGELSELLKTAFSIRQTVKTPQGQQHSRFGMSRREIYPWNEHEPDRNSPSSINDINQLLTRVAPDLEARVTALPALDGTTDTWHQLGLFAKRKLSPKSTILREKSILTAIRPLDDALCDACGADLESVPREAMRQCLGEACDTTFCSDDCALRASTQYHKPFNKEENNEEDNDYPPAYAPFCGNTALHEIGRTSSTDTAEWDLYFLLLTRAIQMSVTQNVHLLDLPEIRFLWGDFESAPDAPSTLPFSSYHNVSLPLQFYETLMYSVSDTKPYSAAWLANYDWWIVQTLYAKFRGVANAQQSTYDGKPEIAAVHPMWCLANHSCAPNVCWTPTGVREFRVLTRDELMESGEAQTERAGIDADEEIWSHYTDVRLPVTERRDRLQEVLGGTCRCKRCLREAEG